MADDRKVGWLVLLLVCVGAFEATALDQVKVGQSMLVGRSVEIENVVFDGPELKVQPITDETAVIVRIKRVFAHGSAFRYDMEAYALEPGEYELRDFLEPVDAGEPVAATANPSFPNSFKLTVESSLADGQIEPYALTSNRSPWLGGYRFWLIAAALVWIRGLLWLIFSGRKKKNDDQLAQAVPVTTADRLRPLLRDAVDGKLAPDQRALLERLLLTHWRERLRLTNADPAVALAELRAHPEAGELLRNLEEWLHRPDPPKRTDVERLLAPYLKVAENVSGKPSKVATDIKREVMPS